MPTYKIVRFATNFTPGKPGSYRRVIKTGLTLEEAQAHCQDPETASKTATGRLARRYRQYDAWFDGYEEEK